MTLKNSRNTFRIIAGKWRGRHLRFPDVQDLRPTPDRVRETLFNWLQLEIHGANCLDLFSGSGALGFEALSRGARSITAVELNGMAADSHQANALLLETPDTRLINGDVLQWLAAPECSDAFDVVFLDPPYAMACLQQCCDLLATGNWLADGARIYLEFNSALTELTLPTGWQWLKNKKAGQVYYGLCGFEADVSR